MIHGQKTWVGMKDKEVLSGYFFQEKNEKQFICWYFRAEKISYAKGLFYLSDKDTRRSGS